MIVMASFNIIKFPEKILRKKASKVAKIGDCEKAELKDMAETMYLNKGVGLAAVQVGINKQMAVVDVGDSLIKLINPAIIKKEGSEVHEEGCLSVPDTIVKVRRAKKIVVSFLNEEGLVSQIVAEGLLARVIQHEIDHLSGKLIIDYLNPIKKLFVKRRTKSLTNA